MRKFSKWMVLAVAIGLFLLAPDARAEASRNFVAGSHLLGANFGLKLYRAPQGALTYDYGLVSFGTGELTTLALGAYLSANPGWATLAARWSIQVNVLNGLNLYFGTLVGASYEYLRETHIWLLGSNPFPTWDACLGLRYMFNDHWGFHSEFAPTVWPDFALPFITMGVNCKI